MIRKATEEDIPSIRALFESEPGFWNPAWDEGTIQQGLETAGDLALVWEEDGQISGFACAYDLGFRAYLSELIVSHQARGRHIGQKLLEAIEGELLHRGRTVLVADVWKNAVGFYEAQGWSPPDVVLLRKRLTEA